MQNSKKITLFQLYWKHIKKFKFSFFFIFFLYTTLSFERVYFPYLVGDIIDILTKIQDQNRGNYWQFIKTPIYIMVSIMFIMDVLFRLQEVVSEYIIPRFRASIREESLEYIINHSNRFFSENHPGSVSSQLTNIVDSASALITKLSCVFIPVLSTVLVSIITIILMNTKVGLIFTGWMAAHISITFFTKDYIRKHWEKWSESANKLNGKIVDTINNITNVRLYSKFKDEMRYCRKFQSEAIDLSFKAGMAGIIVRSLLSFISITFLIAILYFIFDEWKVSAISIGNISAIMAIVVNSVLLLWWISYESVFFFMDLGKANQALELLNTPHEIINDENAPNLIVGDNGSKIECRDLAFGYGDKVFFENTKIVINAGEKIGLVGFSGAGKTTFANLILREFNLKSGQILIDGQDISKVSLQSLREAISYITQDTNLFHRTIMENIRFAKQDATDEEIFEAAKQACCHDFIMKNKDGYQALVGEKGTKLSGGQKQRISIARAILKNAPIVILDEATSALDSITEKKIKDAIEKLTTNKTTLIIAHRLSTLKNVDRILVFDNGKIIEDGTHDELMKIENGFYKKLWESQHDLYDVDEDS